MLLYIHGILVTHTWYYAHHVSVYHVINRQILVLFQIVIVIILTLFCICFCSNKTLNRHLLYSNMHFPYSPSRLASPCSAQLYIYTCKNYKSNSAPPFSPSPTFPNDGIHITVNIEPSMYFQINTIPYQTYFYWKKKHNNLCFLQVCLIEIILIFEKKNFY